MDVAFARAVADAMRVTGQGKISAAALPACFPKHSFCAAPQEWREGTEHYEDLHIHNLWKA